MLSVDHVVTTTRTLDDACRAWRRLGFFVTERGYHPFGTMNNLITLGQTYVELFALNDPSAFDSAVRHNTMPADLAAITRIALETRDGPSILALTSDDPASDLIAVEQRGVSARPPMYFKRQVLLPDGRQTAAEVTVHFLPESDATHVFPHPEATSVPVFVSVQHNAEALWVAEWQAHDNGALDIAEVVYTAGAPTKMLPYLTSLLGAPVDSSSDGFHVFTAGPTRVVVMTPSGCQERFVSVMDEELSDAPIVSALTIGVRDVGCLREQLTERGVRYASTSHGSVQVGRSEAAGTLLEFVNKDSTPTGRG